MSAAFERETKLVNIVYISITVQYSICNTVPYYNVCIRLILLYYTTGNVLDIISWVYFISIVY